MPLLQDLLLSLRACQGKIAFDIGILDLGLSEQNRNIIGAFGAVMQKPGVDVEYPDRVPFEQSMPYVRLFTARCAIPDYFPGYDAYLWLDADTWAQTPEALEVMLNGAARGTDLYIASEFDAVYPAARGGNLWEAWHNTFKHCFTPDIADFMCLRPLLNAGVFAMSPRAPHWQRLRDILGEALGRIPQLSPVHCFTEQACLNILVYKDNLGVQIMPPEFNWMTVSGLPAWDETAELYVRPMPPHRVISIMHLAAEVKNSSNVIETVGGARIERPLTYSVAKAA